MAQRASSSPTFTYTSYTNDVFLSFRGTDSRIGFTGNLYSALCQRGVLTFIDDDLRKGEDITDSLIKAIKKSRMAIIIFTKNYASSRFCLMELVEILECSKEKGQWIWPVFYDVDPSEVRHQTGTFGEALALHEKGIFKNNIAKVRKWRCALQQAANLSGWHFKQQGGEYEHAFIRRVVDEVSLKLNRPLLHVANYPVGLDAHMRNVQSLLRAKSGEKVIMLGISGIGGIGKSTLGRAIYNLIANQFEGSCFLANVREKSTRHGLAQIQETLLSELVGERNIKLGDMNRGIPLLKERLHRKRVLLILDDVNKMEQLQATAGGLDWFGLGSIIIITTRDKHLLDIHGVKKQYEVNKLPDTEALELFTWNAFKNNEVDPSFMGILKHAIHYASGLPLALEIIGSNLFGKTVDEWASALKSYERIPNGNIQEILRVSYDGLEENEKQIFLDIACFFIGCSLRYVTDMLYARHGFHQKYGIRVLVKKSFIKILKCDYDVTVTMHDLIQYMGKEIVRQQSTWPDRRNRLWFREDIIHILEKNAENYEVEAMMLDMSKDKEVHWNQEVFGKLKNLKMLIKRSACYFRSPKHLPNSLRVLEWQGYPSASLPSDFHTENLIVLNLSHSCFQWDKPLEKSKSLSHLIFTGCESIRQIPDVSSSPNLTELCVDDCTNLIEIHGSVGCLDKLKRFSAKGCTKLRIVPDIKLPSLEYLCLQDCSSVDIFPEILGPMPKLQFVDFEGTAITNLPLSMQNVGGLQSLNLNRCTMLNVDALSNIVQMLPIFFSFLEALSLDCSSLTMVPECIKECHILKILSVNDCQQLEEIRWLPQDIRMVSALNCPSLNTQCSTSNIILNWIFHDSSVLRISCLTGQRLPDWFDHSCRGNSVRFCFRNGIPDITVGLVTVRGTGPFDCFVKINNEFKLCCYTASSNWGSEKIQIHNYFHAILSSCPTLYIHHGWNYAEILFLKHKDSAHLGLEPVRWTGVYVNRQITSMQDIRFIKYDPLKDTCDSSSYSCRRYCNSDSMKSARTIYSSNVLYNKYFVHFLCLLLASVVVLTIWPMWFFHNITVICTKLYRAVLDNLKIAPGESIQAPGFAKTENIRDLSAKLSIDKVSEKELDHKKCCTEESFRCQIDQGRDDVEMEAFYASLDARTHAFSQSCDKSTTISASEDAREALKIVQDFISNDASILLHPEQCSVVKSSIDYLSNLSEDDGISGEMITLISEASREFTHWRKEYIEAGMKIKSTTSELLRADKLEADLQDNKKQFREVVTLESELLQKLAYMEERKKELEEQINAIKADISSSQSEKNMAHQRKRDTFEEGKILKTQREELREKVPQLKLDQGLAKRTQEKVTAEWSKLREKFNKIIAE